MTFSFNKVEIGEISKVDVLLHSPKLIPMKKNFISMLRAQWALGKFVCVGLDIDDKKIPSFMKDDYPFLPDRLIAFNRGIIDKTKDLANSYKLNSAFYEQYAIPGMIALKRTIEIIQEEAPNVPIILDAKRADIGNTNEAYAVSSFDWLGADAITVHPYLGSEAMKPFLNRIDKGIIVLCRTSNPGAGEFQDIHVHDVDGSSSLYKIVAKIVSLKWNTNGNCLLVVGATYPNELKDIREIVGDMPILIPGIGAQGGDLEKALAAGFDSKMEGVIINSSRGIIYASNGEDFAEAARKETEKLNQKILVCRDALYKIKTQKMLG